MLACRAQSNRLYFELRQLYPDFRVGGKSDHCGAASASRVNCMARQRLMQVAAAKSNCAWRDLHKYRRIIGIRRLLKSLVYLRWLSRLRGNSRIALVPSLVTTMPKHGA
jgi:hypothetical protein